MGPDPNPPRRPRPPSAHAGRAARPRSFRPHGPASGGPSSVRPSGPGARPPEAAPVDPSRRAVATGERIVARLLAQRLRVCRDLGISVPERLQTGPPETLLLRLTGVDRRLSRELDSRGGVALPPWAGRPDPLDFPEEVNRPEEEDAAEDDDDDDGLEEEGEPAWAA